jgi:hypothetical protein
MDSNHRRHSRQIYSLLPLATRVTLRTFWPSSSQNASTSVDGSELARGFEPLTTCLQNRCSAVELRQPSTAYAAPAVVLNTDGRGARRLLPGRLARKQQGSHSANIARGRVPSSGRTAAKPCVDGWLGCQVRRRGRRCSGRRHGGLESPSRFPMVGLSAFVRAPATELDGLASPPSRSPSFGSDRVPP